MAGIPSNPSSGGNSFQENIGTKAASEQLSALLSELPPDMHFIQGIKDAVKGMTPAGLNMFVFALRQEIEIIMEKGTNNFGTKVGRIMDRVLKNNALELKSGEVAKVGNMKYASNDETSFDQAA